MRSVLIDNDGRGKGGRIIRRRVVGTAREQPLCKLGLGHLEEEAASGWLVAPAINATRESCPI